ncbi:glycosyl transferase [Ferrigenium kumadai]|uniref:Glycosyl transferase n=1 Tax=Ferrigenium kumadai TaxID=1682490 RepID=A0AAN1T0S8_9PROT|nr:glycosyltransferase family 4 protein [Ferrigenium kumadai]BBJ00631.1 glycosyl transferase [Ferrigenium kumadai]
MIHYAPLISALVSILLISFLLSSKAGKSIQDIPNERSLHSAPIPRIGGVGLMAGTLSGWIFVPGVWVWWAVLPMLILCGVSLHDDMRGLPVRQRLMAHFVAAVLWIAGSGLLTQYGIWVGVVALLFVVWMTNLYNFMDGSDGLAGGMALFGFACYGVAALIAHDDTLAMQNFCIAAAALGFLYHNFPPAKVFMGDAGSIPLGFLASAMGLWGWQQGHWAAWFPLLVFSPFIVDASATLVKRSLRGAKVTEAHREHYYQRAIQLGWGHRKVALAEYVLMASAGVSALWALRRDDMVLVIAPLWLAIYIILMRWLDARWLTRAGG